MYRYEEDLVNNFIKLKNMNEGFIKECSLRWGNIDIVEYETKSINYLTPKQIDTLKEKDNLMIFSLLYKKKPHTLSYLLKRVNFNEITLIKRLSKLEEINIIESSGHLYSINNLIDFPDITVTAYEMKLHDIRKAINQAVINKKYTDYSYVVMPYDKYQLGLEYKKVFQNNSIGLILVDDSKYYEVIRPKKINNLNWNKLISKLKIINSIEIVS